MKKLIFAILFLAMVLPETQANILTSTNAIVTLNASSSAVVTAKRPRKKKGFLWGLFKKKNKGCGCPKH